MAQTRREISLGLPQERGHVVVERPAASALKIYEPRLAVLYHDVAALEVAVHERAALRAKEHIGEILEVVLKTVFLKFKARGLQETVFEVIEVPQNRARVEMRRGIALREIHPDGSAELHVGQETHRLGQQLLLLGRKRACKASLLNLREKEAVAEVVLYISHRIRS